MAEIKTRIILRNDTAENWENSEVKLKKGESAVEIVDGKAKLKIATADDQTFASAAYVGGAEANVFQVELAADETDIEAAIDEVVGDTELAVGDIAIVKATIGDSDKTSYTSYVYDKFVDEKGAETFAWTAMDGNYSATNVYLNKSIKLTSAVGNYAKDYNIAAGTNLETVLSGLLQKEEEPSVSKPAAEITASSGSGEVGTEYTVPTATLKVTSVGSYTYGPATGIVFNAGDIKLAEGADPAAATNYKVTNTAINATNNSVLTLKATGDKILYADTAKSYTFSGTASYQAAIASPVTNLGNPSKTQSAIPAGSVTIADKTVRYSGYRYAFAGGSSIATLDSATIRSMSSKKSSFDSMDAQGEALEFTAAKGATKVFFAYPSTWNVGTKKPYFEMFGLAWAENTDITAKADIQVADARGTVDGALQGAIAYKLYCWELDTPLQAESTKFRVWFK